MGRPYTQSNDERAFDAGFGAAVDAVHAGMNVSYPLQVVEHLRAARAKRRADSAARVKRKEDINRAYGAHHAAR